MTRELPNNVPYAAKRSLIRSFQQSWEAAAMTCFEEVHRVFKEVLENLARRHFERYTTLHAAAWFVVHTT